MIGRIESTRLSDRLPACVAGLLALLAVLGCFAPVAPAFTPTPSGQFLSDTGSGEEAAQRSRFNDVQSGLQLALRAQEASDRGAYEEAELLYQQAVPLFEHALGPEDLRMVGPLANLADVYRALGKFDRALIRTGSSTVWPIPTAPMRGVFRTSKWELMERAPSYSSNSRTLDRPSFV